MKLSARIDWIACTHLGNLKRTDLVPMTKPEVINNSFNYDDCVRTLDGVVVMKSRTRPDMGIHTILTATTLDKLFLNHDLKAIDILRKIVETGGRMSRLDICLDVRDGGLEIEKIVELYESGKVVTSARKAHHIKNVGAEGQTFYIGARGSRQLLRIYNKGAQLELDEDWVRIELELRKSASRSATDILLLAKDYTSVIPGLIKGFVDFPEYRIWCELMDTQKIELTAPEQAVGNTRRWLLETCSPSIARLFKEGDTSILRDVMSRASDLIREMSTS